MSPRVEKIAGVLRHKLQKATILERIEMLAELIMPLASFGDWVGATSLVKTIDIPVADLAGEMRRLAAFIGADVPEERWPAVVERCTFEAMRADEARVGALDMVFKGGLKSFVFKDNIPVGESMVQYVLMPQGRGVIVEAMSIEFEKEK